MTTTNTTTPAVATTSAATDDTDIIPAGLQVFCSRKNALREPAKRQASAVSDAAQIKFYRALIEQRAKDKAAGKTSKPMFRLELMHWGADGELESTPLIYQTLAPDQVKMIHDIIEQRLRPPQPHRGRPGKAPAATEAAAEATGVDDDAGDEGDDGDSDDIDGTGDNELSDEEGEDHVTNGVATAAAAADPDPAPAAKPAVVTATASAKPVTAAKPATAAKPKDAGKKAPAAAIAAPAVDAGAMDDLFDSP